jgi:hypothetical protein
LIAFSNSETPYHIWYIGCSGAMRTAFEQPSAAFSHSPRPAYASPMPVVREVVVAPLLDRFAKCVMADVVLLGSHRLVALVEQRLESLRPWFGQPANATARRNAPRSFMWQR